jgi:hypothetical protein
MLLAGVTRDDHPRLCAEHAISARDGEDRDAAMAAVGASAMTVETIGRTIQLILAPVVMVTSCAILVGGMLTLYGNINDRLRALAHERLDLLRTPNGTLDSAAMASDSYQHERLYEIDGQLPGLLRRHEMVHNAVLATYAAILVFVLSMFVIAMAAILSSPALATMALVIFLLGTGVLLIAVLQIALQVRISNDAVQYEVRRVMGLGK